MTYDDYLHFKEMVDVDDYSLSEYRNALVASLEHIEQLQLHLEDMENALILLTKPTVGSYEN